MTIADAGPRPAPTVAHAEVLRACGLVKSFHGRRAVDGVSLSLRAGVLHGLLGPNGAGKTTLLRMLLGLIAPDAGDIEPAGRELIGGFVEAPAFYPYLSGRANLELLAELDGGGAHGRVEAVLAQAGLSARAGARVSGYSSGMRQRLGIAAALLRAPRLLVLDEPANGLDPAGARELAALVRRLADTGVAVLLSSHQIGDAERLCDAFTVLGGGRVLWSGTRDAVRDAAPLSAYRLTTSDDSLALALAARRTGVRAAPARDGGLTLDARPEDLDPYVVALGARGLAIRGLEPVVGPLQALFDHLTSRGDEPGAAATVSVPAPIRETRPERGAVRRAFRAERRKLAAALGVRVLALTCALAPFAFAAVLTLQSGVPGDTLFGVWVHGSGLALPLVVLGFAGQWGFPVIAGIVAGDLVSAEDRYGTWSTVLTHSATRRDLLAGKLLAAALITTVIAAVTALSSVLAGLLVIGHQPIVGLSGDVISPWAGLGLVLAAWAASLAPLLSFVALAVAVSAVTRNGILGVLAPLLVALVVQLLALIGNGAWPHALLIGAGFADWHGLFTAPRFLGPLAVGTLASAAWALALLATAWRSLRARDFAGAPVGRRAGWRPAARIALTGAAALVIAVAATGWGPPAVTAARLRASFAPAFNNLTVLQQRQLGRPVAPGARLDALTACQRRAANGAGDWVCTVDVLIPQPGMPTPYEQTVSYDVSVQSDGCWKADAPPALVGGQLMSGAGHRVLVNPLFTIYGCFDPL